MKRVRIKKFAFLPVLFAALLLAACTGGEQETETLSTVENQIHGIIVDAGEVNALCPDGWNSVGMPDLSAADPDAMLTDALRFVKGGSAQEDLLKDAFIEIRYYKSEDSVPEIEPQKWYDNIADTGEISTGNYTWSGYSGLSMGVPFVYLQTKTDSAVFTATLYSQEGTAYPASVNDADVQAILYSIGISGK